MKIENNKITLRLNEKLRYFRSTLIALGISILCLTNMFSKLPFTEFNFAENVNDKIGLFFLSLSLLTYLFLNKKLEIKTERIVFSKNNVSKLILEKIEKTETWNLYKKSENLLIIETIGNSKNIGYSKNGLISPGYGSRIYIGFLKNEFFVKSLSNFSKETILNLNMGENKVNERIITEIIKSTANNV